MNLRHKALFVIVFTISTVCCSEDGEEISSDERDFSSEERSDIIEGSPIEVSGQAVNQRPNIKLVINETEGKSASKQIQSKNSITFLDGSQVSSGHLPGYVSSGSIPSYVSYWPSANKKGEPVHNLVLQRGHVHNFVQQPPHFQVGVQPCVPKHIKVPYTVYVTKTQLDGNTITSYLPRATDYITTTKFQVRYMSVTSTATRTVRVTVTGTRFITKTTSLTRISTKATYITRTQSVPQYITRTQTLPKYITRTQSVPQYITRTHTVPHYITTTEKHFVTLTQLIGAQPINYPTQTIPQYVAVTETVPQFIAVTETVPQYVAVTESPYATVPQVAGGGIGDTNIYSIADEVQVPGPNLQVQHVSDHGFRFGSDTRYQSFNPNGDQFAIINSGRGHVQGNYSGNAQEVGFIG